MGMGQYSKCHLCQFEFWGGHSHHAGHSAALCVMCLTEFVLPTANPWGPEINELIVLHKVLRASKIQHKKKPPLISYSYQPTDEFLITESAGKWGVNYPIAHMVCPCCKGKGTLVLDFEDGQHCPKCRDGVLKFLAVTY